MQTALHIYSLVRELGDCLPGSTFVASEFYKKEREAYIHFKSKKGILALGLVYHPLSFGVFLIPKGKLTVETPEKPWPFFQLAAGGEVLSVEQVDFDRIFRIHIQKSGEKFTIVIEAIGPNSNLWLLDGNDRIIATLRNKEYDPAKPYQPPTLKDKWNPLELDFNRLRGLLTKSDQTVENVLRKNIIGLDRFLIEETAERANIDSEEPSGRLDDDSTLRMLHIIKEICAHFENYDYGYFYEHFSGNVAFPFKLHTLGEKFEKCKSLSMAVYHAVRAKRTTKEEIDEKQLILEAINRHVKRLARKAGNIEQDLKAAHNFEQYRKYAELLKIYLPRIKKGDEFAGVSDVYADGSPQIIIELDPALTPSQNIEEYFKKYRKGKDSLELLERRLEIGRSDLASAREMAQEFEQDFDTASAKYEAEIAAILPKSVERTIPAPRLPYRPHTLSTGVTIFIGRDGADNDNTTFGHAKPYELWFHASQCPGSHVVMKFPNKDFVPSKSEIAETASIAAYHSRARNSKAVPVIYTQRKYVRKPRNAKPGLVTVEYEKLIMIEPKKPE